VRDGSAEVVLPGEPGYDDERLDPGPPPKP
jgi:hypothetical protein